MSHETTLRAVYDAMNNQQVDAIVSHIAEDAVFHLLPNPLLPATTLEGRDAIKKFMDDHITDLAIQQQIEQIAVSGDFATAFVVSTSKGEDGAPLTVHWADTYQFVGDQIAQHVSLAG